MQKIMPLGLLLAGLAIAPAMAQDQNENVELFQEFVGPLIAADYEYFIKFNGPAGQVLFEGVDVRKFKLVAQGQIMMGDVYANRDNMTHIGLEISTLNPSTGDVYLHQFFPVGNIYGGDTKGRISKADNGTLQMHAEGTSPGPGGVTLTHKTTCTWAGAELSCQTSSPGPDGNRFISIEARYVPMETGAE